MKRTPLLVAFLVAAPLAWAAPAPVYKDRPSLEAAHRALPEELRRMIESFLRHIPESIARDERNLRLARTEKEKAITLSGIAVRKAEFYRHPIELLEYQRQRPPYQSQADQRKIEAALKFYRLRYHEAKRKGLFVETPYMTPFKRQAIRGTAE